MGVVLILTLTPINEIKPSLIDGFIFENADKFVHTILFLVATALLNKAYKVKIYKSFTIMILFGLGIEILQEKLEMGRNFEWNDLLADTLGVLIFWLYYLLFKKDKLNYFF